MSIKNIALSSHNSTFFNTVHSVKCNIIVNYIESIKTHTYMFEQYHLNFHQLKVVAIPLTQRVKWNFQVFIDKSDEIRKTRYWLFKWPYKTYLLTSNDLTLWKIKIFLFIMYWFSWFANHVTLLIFWKNIFFYNKLFGD